MNGPPEHPGPLRGPARGGEGAMPPGQRHTADHVPMHYGRVPRIEADRWSFTIGGATSDGGATVLDLAAVRALPQVTVGADLHCVSRVSVTGLVWTGVAMSDLVALAPPEDGVAHVLFTARYGYSSAVHLRDLGAAGALLATGLDGQALTPGHGWPARIVLPRLYGFKGPKWVLAMDYHHSRPQGYWEKHGYHPRGRVWDEERYAHRQ